MLWYHYVLTAIGLLVATWIYKIATAPDPTPTQVRVARWKKAAKDLGERNQLNNEVPMPVDHNPLAIALYRRGIIENLVWTGHAHVAEGILSDVDDIISTVEANHYALDKYGYGEWRHSGQYRENPHQGYPAIKLCEWVPNDSERFKALGEDTNVMLRKLDDIIVTIRGIATEGVKSSAESAKLRLQVRRQDLEETTAALAESGTDIAQHALGAPTPAKAWDAALDAAVAHKEGTTA